MAKLHGHLFLAITAVLLTAVAVYGLVQCVEFYLPRVLGQSYPVRATMYGDFDYYFEASSRFLHDPATLYDRAQMMAFMGYVYPPIGILFFVPFVWLGKDLGFVAFSAISLILGCLAAWMMAVWIARDRIVTSGWAVPVFILAIVGSTPFYANLLAVQFNLVVLCCCAGALLAGSRGYSALAGLLLAIACWMKIYPGILLLVMLSLESFRPTAFKAIVAGIALPVLLLPVMPVSVYADFLDALPQLSGQSLVQLDNQSITASLGRLSLPIEQWPRYQIVQATFPVRLVNLAAGLVLVGLMVWRGASARTAERGSAVALCALACVPLFSPQGWGHAYVFAVPLVACMAVFDGRPAVRMIAVLCWLALLVPASHVFRWLEQMPLAAGSLIYSRYVLAVSAVILLTLLLPFWRPQENARAPLLAARSLAPPGRREAALRHRD